MKKSIKIEKNVLDKWSEQTNENDHINVRINIASYFSFIREENFFKKILSISEKKKYLTECQRTSYLKMSDVMLKKIRKIYGDDVYNSVLACL